MQILILNIMIMPNISRCCWNDVYFYRTLRISKVKIIPTFSKVLQSIVSDLLTTKSLIKFEMNLCLPA